jgi:WD40 repeat protein
VAERAAKWARRHRPAVAAAVFSLLGIAGLGLAASWRSGALNRHKDELRSVLERADRNERTIERAAYLSQWKAIQQAWAGRKVETVQQLLEELRPEPGRRDQRGFEWHLLRRLAHRNESILLGHDARVRAVAPSPDGHTLASGDELGWMILWDLESWRERGRVKAHARAIQAIRFSPDGEVLATLSRGARSANEIGLWKPATLGEPIQEIEIPSDVDATEMAFSADGRTLMVMGTGQAGGESRAEVTFRDLARDPKRPARDIAPISCKAAAIAPGGRWLAVLDPSGVLTLRDPATGEARATVPGRFPAVDLVALTADGRTVAAGRRGTAEVTFHDAGTGRALGSAPGVEGRFQFSPAGDRLVAANWSALGHVSLIRDAGTRPAPVPLEGLSGEPWCFAFSPDGAALAVGGDGLPPTVWDVASGRLLGRYRFDVGVRDMVFATDGQALIFGSTNGRVYLWRPGGPDEPVISPAGHGAEAWALAYTPDGSTLISAGDDHSIRLWDPGDGRLRTTLEGHTALVASLAVSPDGSTLASAGFDRTVRLWDLPSGRPRASLLGHTDRVRAVAFSRDGRLIASAGSDSTVRLWDAAACAPLRVLEGHTDTVRALAFHPGGVLLASSSDDRTIRAWDLAGDRAPISLACPKHNAALAFSPDGTLLASGDDWGNVSIRDVATWAPRTSVKGSDAPVWGLAFSPDGRTLAAACGDATVRLWNPLSGQVTLVLDGHTQRVNAVAFAPGGQALASASHDGAIKLWRGDGGWHR